MLSFRRKIEAYSQEYGKLKGMKKLEWKANLGMVDVSTYALQYAVMESMVSVMYITHGRGVTEQTCHFQTILLVYKSR